MLNRQLVQAVNVVATMIVQKDRNLLPAVNGLLEAFGHAKVGLTEEPAAQKADPVYISKETAALATEKEQRSGLFVVDSTLINALEYKAPRRYDSRRPHLRRTKSKLIVTFVRGGQYEYTGVSQRTFDAFMAAESKGEFFNENIKDQYPTRRLDK